jgi:Methylenetetrahydrofolate reductase
LGKPILYAGKEVVIHLTCKDLNRNGLESEAWSLNSEGFHNILAMTGDYPSDARKYGLTLAGAFPLDALSTYGRSIAIVNDRNQPPDPAFLQSLKASGMTIAFSSGGEHAIDEARLKRRLQAIRAARLSAQDFWIQGD